MASWLRFAEQPASPCGHTRRVHSTHGSEFVSAHTHTQLYGRRTGCRGYHYVSENEAGMRSTITRAEEILNIARPKGEFESTPEYEARIAEYNALIPVLRAP